MYEKELTVFIYVQLVSFAFHNANFFKHIETHFDNTNSFAHI